MIRVGLRFRGRVSVSIRVTVVVSLALGFWVNFRVRVPSTNR